MSVVAAVEDAPAPRLGLDEEDEPLAAQAHALDRVLQQQHRGGRETGELDHPVGAPVDEILFGGLGIREQVKVVVQQLHLEHGLRGRRACAGERLAA